MINALNKYAKYAVATCLLFPFQSSTSFASCCGEVAAINAAQGNIVSAIASSEAQIVRAIAGSADIIKGENTASSKDIAHAQAMHNAAISNVEAETRARQDFMAPPDPCASYSVAASGASAREAVSRRSGDLQGQATRKQMSMPGPSAKAKEAIKKHTTLYCSEEDVRQNRCKSVSDLPSGDTTATSVTTGAGRPGSVSPTFTAKQSAAAFDFTANVVNGEPSVKLSSVEEKTPDGQIYIGKQLHEQAKLSLAAQPFYDAIAYREPVPGLKPRILAIWNKMEANGVAVPENIKKSLTDQDQASNYFLMKTEIDRRVNNPQWLTDIMSASPASVNREIAVMQAQMLQLQFQQQMQNEMIAKLLGGLYAEQVQANAGPAMKYAYGQVKSTSATSQ